MSEREHSWPSAEKRIRDGLGERRHLTLLGSPVPVAEVVPDEWCPAMYRVVIPGHPHPDKVNLSRGRDAGFTIVGRAQCHGATV
jgi:hypothetical protein